MKIRFGLPTLLAVLACTALLGGTAWAATATVKLTADNTFQSGAVSVQVGDTVDFTWDGGFHDVTFDDGVSSGTPVGDVGTTFSRTFTAAGSFGYVCTVHQALGMTGSVTVVAAESGTVVFDADTPGGVDPETPAGADTVGAPPADAAGDSPADTVGAPPAGAAGDSPADTVGSSGTLPYTGPEDSLLPLLGAALLIGGIVALSVGRRSRA